MSKSKRLLELMLTVNRMRKFTVKELADQFGVSKRTILRDLQELSELGVPLYSEVGPHGGYQVLNERILPPIAFGEDEAVAMFFASHALRHYLFMPFEKESAAALHKFYLYMPGDVRDRIDQIKNRVDIYTPTRQQQAPCLSVLMEAAVYQNVIQIQYTSGSDVSQRLIQPIGIFASSGFWYCPSYCFLRQDFRLFRCDRITSAAADPTGQTPMDHRHIHLGNWEQFLERSMRTILLEVDLTSEGVERCEAELRPAPQVIKYEDGSGAIRQSVPASEMVYFARFFIGLGDEAQVVGPPELIDEMRQQLSSMLARYT
ncbi:helix-turn-helix transcriptional regulator [Paenibacillus lemnae]|uniref:YafY family transcriptional regulator n=1 Tax=Paenibacillus lemnae TaxID=1330551 RepID=A0A848M2H2_PAELE|nr:YafY family protein [Paenibacillus lemnae]NMO95097.1 YafY family transcriptional regulator [Paenibacillus lemnae]